jgi:hypothetical protein
MSKKLPNTLYVVLKEEGTEDAFLHADETYMDICDDNCVNVVGVYELKEKIRVSTIPHKL